jgi:hypothetical protein
MRVFISHASEDTWVALRIAACIKELGVETFLDVHDIAGGDDFEERILEAEGWCDELLVLLTPAALKSAYVAQEIAYFRHSNKRIVPIRYGVPEKSLSRAAVLPPFIRKLNMRHLNDLEGYLAELAGRARGDDP